MKSLLHGIKGVPCKHFSNKKTENNAPTLFEKLDYKLAVQEKHGVI